MTKTTKRHILPALTIAAMLGAFPAAPAKAGLLDGIGDIICIIGCSGGGSGGGSAPTPPVDPTGRIHPVYMVGGSFFPDVVHAKPGDIVKFYNLANTSQRVRANDYSWTSDFLSRDESWEILVTGNTELEFHKTGFGRFYGAISLDPLPASVDYGDLVDANGNVVGKGGTVARAAQGLGRTLAGVGGVVQDTTGALGDTVGGLLGVNSGG
ncbi:hypothetical protein [Pseudooceanicola sp. MF1-13]|uniref:hypothetical protein n=1 Tax=Pseudooceanicola sp. MF1-13 TaxID=3379095 RepID=UPI0038929920